MYDLKKVTQALITNIFHVLSQLLFDSLVDVFATAIVALCVLVYADDVLRECNLVDLLFLFFLAVIADEFLFTTINLTVDLITICRTSLVFALAHLSYSIINGHRAIRWQDMLIFIALVLGT